MINLNNIPGVVNQALTRSPLLAEIHKEKGRRESNAAQKYARDKRKAALEKRNKRDAANAAKPAKLTAEERAAAKQQEQRDAHKQFWANQTEAGSKIRETRQREGWDLQRQTRFGSQPSTDKQIFPPRGATPAPAAPSAPAPAAPAGLRSDAARRRIFVDKVQNPGVLGQRAPLRSDEARRRLLGQQAQKLGLPETVVPKGPASPLAPVAQPTPAPVVPSAPAAPAPLWPASQPAQRSDGARNRIALQPMTEGANNLSTEPFSFTKPRRKTPAQPGVLNGQQLPSQPAPAANAPLSPMQHLLKAANSLTTATVNVKPSTPGQPQAPIMRPAAPSGSLGPQPASMQDLVKRAQTLSQPWQPET